MKDIEIEKIIDAFNSGELEDRVFYRFISGNVAVARVWWRMDEGDSNLEGYPFYLIYNEERACVGAVLDMREDLHAFVKNEHRRKGCMYEAMRDVILPHLLSGDRGTQKATYRAVDGLNLLRKLGFTIIDEKHAEISLTKVRADVVFRAPQRMNLSNEKLEKLLKKMESARALVGMVRDELEMQFDAYVYDALDQLFWDIQWRKNDVTDCWRNLQAMESIQASAAAGKRSSEDRSEA